MIQRFRFGNPIPTGAAVKDVPITETPELFRTQSLSLRILEGGCRLELPLEAKDVIYGLGESLHGMNKRGFTYISNNTDQMHHDENIYSLYGSHNFLLIDRCGTGKLGLFVDYPASVTWDLGFSDKDLAVISVEEADYELYAVTGDTDLGVIREFRELIGESYVAPKWAFGYGQSRWGYKCEEDIRRVVDGYRKNHLPLDAVYMDIDYMTDYKDFTIDPAKFPDFKAFVSELKEEHIHLVPNVDAAVKVEEGYDFYEEGKAKGYYCTEENGETFLTAVWPGISVLPDFMRPEVREWFGQGYKVFFEAGLDGFWNDMNEPALFYSVKNLKATAEDLAKLPDKVYDLSMYDLWEVQGKVNSLANNPEDYRSFYHEVDGRKVRHDRIHNLYGYQMVKGTAEQFKKLVPDKEVLLFSRSSYIGMHRYAGIWTGDNSSYYSHLDLILSQLPNLNMCGFLYVGADTGGFAFNTSEPLLMRFMEISLFTPLFRNHCALGCREQEIYQFKDLDSFRNLLNLRYALIPYLYETYTRCAADGSLMFTPLAMAYPEDEAARTIEDELLVGDAILIAPVTKANAASREVYLPEEMTLYRFRSDKDYDREPMSAGYHHVSAAINEVLIFVRKGKTLYLAEPAESVPEMKDGPFTYLT